MTQNHVGLWQKVMNTPLKRLLKLSALTAVAIAVLAVGMFSFYVLWPAHGIPPLETVDEYLYLDQGWGGARDTKHRETYYYTPQGTSLPQGEARHPLRYSWFVHLEMPYSKTRVADPDHMRAQRFIVDPEPTAANPDQLPVGFTRHFNTVIGEHVLDLSCAVCHTGQIHFTNNNTRYAMRVDGGQAMHAFTDMTRGSFAPVLLSSMLATYVNPIKFRRFARNILGANYPQGKDTLRRELKATIKAFLSTGQNNPFRHLYPVQEGFGRTDALGRIANTVFGDHLVAANYHKGGAPVSYPYVWNIWKFDWVQYNGSVAQPLARNIGEAMGVGAVINLTDINGQPIPAAERFTSSVRIPDLVTIEHTLQMLKPPKWPEHILGNVDTKLASQGKALFAQHCQGCHGPHVASSARQRAEAPGKASANWQWLIEVVPTEHIGTDPTAADGFVNHRYDLTATGLSNSEVRTVLRPVMTRALARDARYRLEQVIALRQEKSVDVGQLPALLHTYPDPDAHRAVQLPQATFAAIAQTLGALLETLPSLPGHGTPSKTSPDKRTCELDCHTQWLLWDVKNGARHILQQLDEVDVTSVSEGAGLNIIGLIIKNKYYQDHTISYEQQRCLEGFGTLDFPQQIAGYKPRPLSGVWATPPFLHNGSVPNLYQMLVPPEQRDKKFFVGRRDYDVKHLGYVTTPQAENQRDGFWLDTSIKGNFNTGHAFIADSETWSNHQSAPQNNSLPSGVIGPLLSDQQRYSLLEYLKIHQDTPLTPANYAPPSCNLSGDTT